MKWYFMLWERVNLADIMHHGTRFSIMIRFSHQTSVLFMYFSDGFFHCPTEGRYSCSWEERQDKDSFQDRKTYHILIYAINWFGGSNSTLYARVDTKTIGMQLFEEASFISLFICPHLRRMIRS